MTEPLRSIALRHCRIDVFDWGCRTVFPDGLSAPATPNGDEYVLDTIAHEWSHSALAQVLHDRPSMCLRGVVEGHGRQWTPDKHGEESLAYPLGLLLADLLKALVGKDDVLWHGAPAEVPETVGG